MNKLILMFLVLFALHGSSKVYITSEGAPEVSVFDPGDNSFVTTFIPSINSTTASNLQGVVISPDGTKAYIVDRGNLGVWIINTEDNSTIAYVPFGGGASRPSQVNVTPDGSKVYVSDEDSGRVYVMTVSDNNVSFFTGGFAKPSGLAFNPSGTKLYISDARTFTGPNSIFVYNVSDDSLNTSFQGGYSNFIAINSFGIGFAPVSDSTEIIVFDTATDTLLPQIISTGGNLEGVAFSSDGLTAYVASTLDNTLQVVRGGAVIFEIPLARPPLVVTVNPSDDTQIYSSEASLNAVMVIKNNIQIAAPAFNDNLTDAQYIAFIELSAPAPAGNLQGQLILNRFVFQTDRVNRLNWTKSSSSDIVGYKIFRDGKYLATVSGLSFEDHNRSKNESNVYQVRSLNGNGDLSDPVSITIP